MAPNHREIKAKIKKNIKFRPNTDDDKIIIPDILGRNIFRLDHLRKFYTPSKHHIIDCGAHIGVFSLLASHYFPKYKIHAFEPNPDNYDYLKINTQNRKNISKIPKGVGTKTYTTKLFQPFEDEHNGSWTLVPNGARHQITDNYVSVPIINVYKYLNHLTDPIFILKLDLEGYEANIINQMPTKLLKKIKIILLEEHEIKVNHKKLTDNNFIAAFNPSNSNRQFVYINTFNQPEIFKQCFEIFRIITFENYRDRYKALEIKIEQSKPQDSLPTKFFKLLNNKNNSEN